MGISHPRLLFEMKPGESQFIFAVCQAGAEPMLKREVARMQPGLRFAFSRPGFVTFRGAAGDAPYGADFEFGASIFARAYGLSLGKCARSGAAAALIEAAAPLFREFGERKLRLHVFARERYAPGEEPKDYAGEKASVKTLRSEILTAAGAAEFFHAEEIAETGDSVFDVILVEESEIWFGWHRHASSRSPDPGGNPGLELPADAPSRAWLKLEEALRWSGAPLRANDIAIEIGAAPGGAAHALLARGLQVYGIDAGEMAPVVRDHPHFRWLRASAREAMTLAPPPGHPGLPDSAEWLVLDIHARGEIALREIDPYVRRYRPSLLGMVLTLKLGSQEMSNLAPDWLERVRAMGMASVRAAQLPSNRQEFCVVALTPRARVSRGRFG